MPRRFRTARQFLARAARRRRVRHQPSESVRAHAAADARLELDLARALDELGAGALELGLVSLEEFTPRRPLGEPS